MRLSALRGLSWREWVITLAGGVLIVLILMTAGWVGVPAQAWSR